MPIEMSRQDATAHARRLKQHLQSAFRLEIRHTQALDALAALLGHRNRHEMEAAYVTASGVASAPESGTRPDEDGSVDPATARFWKTIVQVEVLSEGRPVAFDSLEDLSCQITEGDCSGVHEIVRTVPLSGKAAAAALLAQGSDPEFFEIDESGRPLGEEGEDEAERREEGPAPAAEVQLSAATLAFLAHIAQAHAAGGAHEPTLRFAHMVATSASISDLREAIGRAAEDVGPEARLRIVSEIGALVAVNDPDISVDHFIG